MNKVNLIENLYEWLPEYGENSVSFHSDNGNIILEVTYDADDSVCEKYASKRLIFKSACSFQMSSFPGIIEYRNEQLNSRDSLPLDCLYEYIDSKIARMWSDHFDGKRLVRHFQVFFLSENRRFEIFAKEVLISSEVYFS